MRTSMASQLGVILLLLAGFGDISRARAQPCAVGAEFRPSQLGDRLSLNFHCDALGNKPDNIYIQATVQHEVVHAFKSQGIIDDDVPFAAAAGYYGEWILRGTLLDNTKIPFFQRGMGTVSASNVEALVLKYRVRSEREPLESYDDGAVLAGMIFGQFAKKENDARAYLLALAMGVDHAFAVRVTQDRGLGKVLFSLRMGEYFLFDEQALDRDLRALDPASRQNAERYIKAVNDRFKIGLIPKKDVLVAPFQAPK